MENIKYFILRCLFYLCLFGIPIVGITFSIRSCIRKEQNRIVYITDDDAYLYHTNKECKMIEGKDIHTTKYKHVSDRYCCPICKEEDEAYKYDY